jgi:hypothetical protein
MDINDLPHMTERHLERIKLFAETGSVPQDSNYVPAKTSVESDPNVLTLAEESESSEEVPQKRPLDKEYVAIRDKYFGI